MKAYFYPKSLYNSITAFTEQFNDMTVRVYDPNTGKIVGVKDVPITIAPKEKIASILTVSDVNDVDPQHDNYLPRITTNLAGFNWDPNRMRGKFEKRTLNIEYEDTANGTRRKINVDTQPVPMNLTFELTVWTKYQIDAFQLFENIAVWFAPESHLSIKERSFGIERKSKVTLDNVTPNVVFELGERERRVIQHNYTFTMETVLYKPLEIKPEILCTIIKIADVPCKKVPFQGDAIIVTEDETGSLISPELSSAIRQLDQSEEYDLMVKHWQSANAAMNAHTCIEDDCGEDPGPRPTWSEVSEIVSGCDERTQPTRVVRNIGDGFEGGDTMSTYHQAIVNTDSVLNIVSYRTTVDDTTNEIIEQDVIIPNEEYPDGNDLDGDGIVDGEQ